MKTNSICLVDGAKIELIFDTVEKTFKNILRIDEVSIIADKKIN